MHGFGNFLQVPADQAGPCSVDVLACGGQGVPRLIASGDGSSDFLRAC